MPRLTTNSNLKRNNIWTFSIPALAARLPSGQTILTCPAAGVCANLCYARNGTYNFPIVKAAHTRNLEEILSDLDSWADAMIAELSAKKFRPKGKPRELAAPDPSDLDGWAKQWAESGGAAVRIHDSGDFFNDDYLKAWLKIAETVDDVLCYAYTKEVTRLKRLAADPPANFRYLFSMGGKQDHLINRELDRHVDVFPDMESLIAAGYKSQHINDLWAVTAATNKIGIVQKNIPQFKKRLGRRTFSIAQIEKNK